MGQQKKPRLGGVFLKKMLNVQSASLNIEC
jgi:hypothetical protein